MFDYTKSIDGNYVNNAVQKWENFLKAANIYNSIDIKTFSVLCENLNRDINASTSPTFVNSFKLIKDIFDELTERGHIVRAMNGPIGFHFGGKKIIQKSIIDARTYNAKKYLDHITHTYVYLYSADSINNNIRLAQAIGCCNECGAPSSIKKYCPDCTIEFRKQKLENIKE